MRCAIFSDIHSNLEALDTVLRAYSSEGIDRFFCIGDIVGYGVDPAECVSRLRALPVLTVAGNHDWAVAGVIDTAAFNPYAREAVRWNAEHLDAAARTFLQSLRLVYAEEAFTLVHGTLDSPGEFKYLTDAGDAAAVFALMQTQVCFVGHTHVAGIFVQERDGSIRYDDTSRAVKVEKGCRYIVNVGSVGQPRDGDPRCAYCVFDRASRTIEIMRRPYDVEVARRKILDAGLPQFLGDRLLYGQ